MASALFDRQTRERAWLLYAWCRACDDSADGQDHGGTRSAVTDAPIRLALMRRKTDAAFDGLPTGDPAFDGLAIVAAECAIPRMFAHDLLNGFALDAAEWRPRTSDDLMQYCYHVAGAVGLMMALVMGVSPNDTPTLDRACDLGLAFQLANIARDISEDHDAGRCYIPVQWLDDAGIDPQNMMAPQYRAPLASLAARLARMAGAYEASARHGTPALPLRSAWAVLAAAGIYGDIAREVDRRGIRAVEGRVVTSKAAKLGWVLRALGQAMLRARRWPADTTPRPPALWTRPPASL